MAEKEAADGAAELLGTIGPNLLLLIVSGIAGAFVKGILAPEGNWKKRAIQGVVGVLSAVFLGGFFAGLVEGLVPTPEYAVLAAGFICGTAGELAIAFIQKKILGAEHDAKSHP
ncbi:MAG: hypothetical protein ABNH53_01325 [Henriciella sp.]|jgi:hypothetical protein